MKGGGFLVLLFLLICFLWGVWAVMGGIKNTLSAWFSSEPKPPEFKARRQVVDVVEVPAPAPAARLRPAVADAVSEHQKRAQAERMLDGLPSMPADGFMALGESRMDMETAMQHMKNAHGLHREGVLTDQEFAQIKAQLIRQAGDGKKGAPA